ncbi:MAG: reverse transcriptase/maturase family protein [Chloroflexales bacterium]|nr:reverse transcriptase/maturase family protein [Chloroflexales bacterium]
MPKSFTNLFPQIANFENLYVAWESARRGKRRRPDVAAFERHLEPNLLRLERQLLDGGYQPGRYRSFYIREPKRREISAAPFRDRVVHHALVRVIEPIFEARFSNASYACRVGKGTHRAADHAQTLLRRHRYLLKADIAQFFPSIDHRVLDALLSRHIACRPTLELCRRIMASGDGILASEYTLQLFPEDDLFAALRPRGLPIGNLTSQFWANVYLNGIDTLIQRELRLPHVRYCDDMLIFADAKPTLHAALAALHERAARLRLTLHPVKTRIYAAEEGVEFVGYRLFRDHRRLRRDNVRLFVRRLRRQQRAYRAGRLPADRLHASLQSWIAHAKHADTYRLRSRLLRAHPFVMEHST